MLHDTLHLKTAMVSRVDGTGQKLPVRNQVDHSISRMVLPGNAEPDEPRPVFLPLAVSEFQTSDAISWVRAMTVWKSI